MQLREAAGPIERLIGELYDNADFAGYPSRKYLLPHLPALRQFDPHEPIAYLLREWDYRSGPWFLSRLPELWQTWGCAEWRRLFRLVSPRPQPRPMFLDGYADVQFWLMALKLNPLPLLLSANLDPTELWYVTQQLRIHASMYIREPLDPIEPPEEAGQDEPRAAELAAIDAENEWCEQQLESIRQTLLQENAELLPPWDDAETFRDYVAGVGEQVWLRVTASNPDVSTALLEVASLGSYVAHRFRIGEDGSLTEL